MGIRFDELITCQREVMHSKSATDVNLATGSDRGRILFSAPFRRLQKKAQVFPLETNGAIRSRLTHSLEVAHLGMYIVEKVLVNINSSSDDRFRFLKEHPLAFSTLVENACLMHDLGNPPFGHFGEKAIRDWFGHKNQRDLFLSVALGRHRRGKRLFLSKQYRDFLMFDGNPQGLRIVSKLQGKDGKTGLNLTHSQLASYLKYVASPASVDKDRRFASKPGFFLSEELLVKSIWDSLKMRHNTRHPLAYIMEAADDLAYCVSDIEDGVEKNIITWKHFKEKIGEKAKEYNSSEFEAYIDAFFNYADDPGRKARILPFVSFKTKLNNDLVGFAAKQFVENIEDILCGNFDSIFDSIGNESLMLDVLKKYTREHLFKSDEAENIELAGYSIIKGILDHFKPLLDCRREDFESIVQFKENAPNIGKTDLHRRLVRRLPDSYLTAYKAAASESKNNAEEWYHRAHLIVDYVAGMTDQFALEEFQLLSGIKVV